MREERERSREREQKGRENILKRSEKGEKGVKGEKGEKGEGVKGSKDTFKAKWWSHIFRASCGSSRNGASSARFHLVQPKHNILNVPDKVQA